MEYSILGSTGRKVSRIGFGGAAAGIQNYLKKYNPEAENNRTQMIEAIQKAYELGINFFDTAADYGDGLSEKIFGEALKPYASENLFLATKVEVGNAKFTRDSVEQSLCRLGRDCIDLIQVHGVRYTPEQGKLVLKKDGTLDVLEQAKAEGLVRHIGFTVECQNETMYDFLRSGRFEVMQIEYNLLYQHPYDHNWKCGSMFDAKEKNMGIITMRTLTSGVYQRWGKHVNPDNNFDYNPSLLQFVLSNPLVDVALLGMRSAKRVSANVETCNDLAGRINLDEINAW